MKDACPIEESALRLIADIFGPRGDAFKALRKAVLMREDGYTVEFQRAPEAILVVPIQGDLSIKRVTSKEVSQ